MVISDEVEDNVNFIKKKKKKKKKNIEKFSYMIPLHPLQNSGNNLVIKQILKISYMIPYAWNGFETLRAH